MNMEEAEGKGFNEFCDRLARINMQTETPELKKQWMGEVANLLGEHIHDILDAVLALERLVGFDDGCEYERENGEPPEPMRNEAYD